MFIGVGVMFGCAPKPEVHGKSYYQREAEKQVAADDPAKPQRMDAEQFRDTARTHNPHDYREDVGKAVHPYRYQFLNIFTRAMQ